MKKLTLPSLQQIQQASERIRPYVLSLPLVPLNADHAPQSTFLQLENLQLVGSYKLRGAANAILQTDPAVLARGVATVSAGNLGQGIAWMAKKLGFPCLTLVPDHAPAAKISALKRYGAEVKTVNLNTWWSIMVSGILPDFDGLFIHGVFNPQVMAGHGTIGLEIVQQNPAIESVIIPFGGGAMTCGIAAAVKAFNPDIREFTCEVDTAAPLHAALQHGEPTEIDYQPSFVDGIGSRKVFPEMWPMLQQVVTDSLLVTLDQVRDAIRLLVNRHHVIAEGAGAAALAAALNASTELGSTACVISGGHIDLQILSNILATPAGKGSRFE